MEGLERVSHTTASVWLTNDETRSRKRSSRRSVAVLPISHGCRTERLALWD